MAPRSATPADAAGPLPPRIWVVGPCGGGKSGLADELARAAGVPAIHLDEHHWLPGWVERTNEEMLARVRPLLAAAAWVVDGNYRAVCGSLLCRADLVVWLDLPLTVTIPRLVRRCVARAWSRTPVCNGNRESLRQSFLTKDSVIWWGLTSDRARRDDYERTLSTIPTVRLRSPHAVDAFRRRHGLTGSVTSRRG